MNNRDRTTQLALVAAFILFLIVLIRTAWISPRAYLNFRIVENWVHGYGLGFNVGERILPVSQPVWLLILGLIYWFALTILRVSDLNLLYYLAMSLSIIISLLTFTLLLRKVSHHASRALIVVIGLLISKAFMDFSTSGLENPLVHLLLLLFLFQYLRCTDSPQSRASHDLLLLSLIGALLVALQWELFLLIVVVLLDLGIRLRGSTSGWRVWFILLLPLGIYLLFTTFLYGSPLPSMYTARFHAGLGWGRLARQGVMYLLNLIDFDPSSMVILALGLLAVVAGRARTLYPFTIGTLSTIGLVVLLGGDSISGRLFSPLVFLSALVLSQVDIEFSKLGQAAILMIMAIGLVTARSPLRSGLSYQYPEPDHRGIFDERGVAYQTTGLLKLNRDTIYPPGSDWAGDDWEFEAYQQVIVLDEPSIGFAGYQVGPESYVMAQTGITDPLLTRLPTIDPVVWDLYSLNRDIPEGYETAILEGPEKWSCERLADYYVGLRMVTSHPVFSRGRVGSIWRVLSETPSRKMIQDCQ